MDSTVNKYIDKIRVRLERKILRYNLNPLTEETQPFDDFEEYIGGIADALLAEYDFEKEDDEALDLIFEVVDLMVSEGVIPSIPEGDDSDGLLLWIAKATTAGLAARVMKYAEEGAS